MRHIGGSASSGHYMADAMRGPDHGLVRPDGNCNATSDTIDLKERWVAFDDTIASSTTVAEVLEQEEGQRSAYLVLYAMHPR